LIITAPLMMIAWVVAVRPYRPQLQNWRLQRRLAGVGANSFQRSALATGLYVGATQADSVEYLTSNNSTHVFLLHGLVYTEALAAANEGSMLA
jgi:hypothetical protein